jgi:O-antigen/teichoic acid export membrane protein
MATIDASDARAVAVSAAGESHAFTFGRMIRNVLALGASQIVTTAASATLALMLPRYLGDANLGKLAFASAYTGIFAVFASLGAGLYVTKEVARDSSRTLSYTANAAAMRVPAMIVLALLGVLIVNVAGYDTDTKRTVYVLFLAVGIAAVYDIMISALQGLQEMKFVARAQVAGTVMTAAAVVALLVTGHGIVWVALAYAAGAFLGLLVATVALLRHTGTHMKVGRGAVSAGRRIATNLTVWRAIFIGGLPFFVWQVSLLIFAQIDRVMLSAMTGDAVVGWYEAAYRIVGFPTFVPVIAMTVAFPALANSFRGDRGTFNSITQRAVQGVLIATIPISTGIMVLAFRAPGVLGYPSEFERSIPLMIILAVHIPIMSADMILGTALNAADRQRQWAMAGVAAACLNPSLNAVAIPLTDSAYGNGAIGAASATVATEVFMMVAALWLLPRGVVGWSTLSPVIRALAAAGVMAGTVWLLRDEFIVVPVAVGAAVYMAGCLAMGVIKPSDARLALSYLAERQRAQQAVQPFPDAPSTGP